MTPSSNRHQRPETATLTAWLVHPEFKVMLRHPLP